jgi:hypothetical protein
MPERVTSGRFCDARKAHCLVQCFLNRILVQVMPTALAGTRIRRHGNRDPPDDVRQRWTATLQETYASDPKSVTLLRELRREVDSWDEIDLQTELSLVCSAISAVAAMIEIYQRRFDTR